MFILNYFSSKSFSHFVMMYCFNVDFFLLYFVIFQANFNINYLKFLMFYSMVDKCLMTQAEAAVFNILATDKYTLSLLTLPPR